jgi:hypothetical protein
MKCRAVLLIFLQALGDGLRDLVQTIEITQVVAVTALYALDSFDK